MQVRFYNTSDDRKKVRKSLSLLATVDCDLKENCSLKMPSLILDRAKLTTYASCNYMYIPDFKRYYFCEVTAMVGDMLQIDGKKSDVLMSFQNDIYGLSGIILRQENNYNEYYVDTLLPKRNTKNIQYLKIGELPSQNGIYLTVTGGQ